MRPGKTRKGNCPFKVFDEQNSVSKKRHWNPFAEEQAYEAIDLLDLSRAGGSGDKTMLRITVKEIAAKQTWVLQGRLTKNSIPELVLNWQDAQDRSSKCNRVVDLNEVTVIDKSGEEVLSMMIEEGAKFVASGLYTKHLLQTLLEQKGQSHDPEDLPD
jgi:ABC-type transporter Mla MlaB component